MLSQELGAQLNVNSGAVAPGADTVGADLISMGVKWLTGKGPFVYTDKTSGNTDWGNDGTVGVGISGGITSSPGVDYNSKSAAFTFMGNASQVTAAVAATKTTLASSSSAWSTLVDTGVFDTNTGHDFTVSGVGLKNALQAFDTNQLQTSAHDQITWAGSGQVFQNNAAGMWQALAGHVQGVVA